MDACGKAEHIVIFPLYVLPSSRISLSSTGTFLLSNLAWLSFYLLAFWTNIITSYNSVARDHTGVVWITSSVGFLHSCLLPAQVVTLYLLYEERQQIVNLLIPSITFVLSTSCLFCHLFSCSAHSFLLQNPSVFLITLVPLFSPFTISVILLLGQGVACYSWCIHRAFRWWCGNIVWFTLYSASKNIWFGFLHTDEG